MEIIYKTVNLINNKFYVGKHKTSADDGYLGSGLVLRKAIDKYGDKNFKRETIEFCTSANVNEREKYWITEMSACQIGYNIAPGGIGGFTRRWDNDEKKQISERMTTYWNEVTEKDKRKHARNVSRAKSGKKMSFEFCEQKKQQHIEYWKNKENKRKRSLKYLGSGNPNFGKKHSMKSKLQNKISNYKYNILDLNDIVWRKCRVKEFCDFWNVNRTEVLEKLLLNKYYLKHKQWKLIKV